jgi:integrase
LWVKGGGTEDQGRSSAALSITDKLLRRSRPLLKNIDRSSRQTCQKLRTMVSFTSECLDVSRDQHDHWSKAMALRKKRAAKWRAWNKGLEVGQKDAFTPAQVKRIRQVLTDRGVPGLRDLALFSVAIDTMLQGPELLNLTVKGVALGNGTIRPIIEVARTRRKSPVRCTLSKPTAKALGKWIAVSGKKRADYIFPGRGAGRPRPMTIRQMNRLLKSWVAEAGLDPENYGNESLRRTKAHHILNSTGDLETVRMLLGHEKIESTARYLRIAKKSDPIAISRAFDI